MVIRPADPRTDAVACAAIYAPFVRDTFVTFEEEAPDADAMELRMGAVLATHPWLVADLGDGVLGYAYATWHRARPAYRWTAETTIYVDPAHGRRGIGTALYRHLLESLEAQGVRHAIAGISLPNDASVALHEACGFRAVGVFPNAGWKAGGWRDVGWWQRPLGAGATRAPTELLPPRAGESRVSPRSRPR